jgi:HrpA-like RNA helicase
MKTVNTMYLLQLAYRKIGEHTAHVCNKFSNANAEKFMQHPDFQELNSTGRMYVAMNQKGESWFLLLEPSGTLLRNKFHEIRSSIKTATEINKLEQRAGAHATKANKLWEKADAIKASVDAPQVAITFDDNLPF